MIYVCHDYEAALHSSRCTDSCAQHLAHFTPSRPGSGAPMSTRLEPWQALELMVSAGFCPSAASLALIAANWEVEPATEILLSEPCKESLLDTAGEAYTNTRETAAAPPTTARRSSPIAGAPAMSETRRDPPPVATAPSTAPGDVMPPPVKCSPGKSHMPPASRAHQRKYFLFHAANAGCKACVSYYLEVEKVDPQSVSDYHGCTVMDWAKWALKHDKPGALDVVSYLRKQWRGVRSKDERAVMALLDTQNAA